MYSTEILLNTATIREVHSSAIDFFCLRLYGELKHRNTRHYSSELQTATPTLTTSKYSIDSTYSDFPCHFIVDRDKLALINRRLKCKREKVDDYL